MMTRRSLSWKLSKALERSGASDPRVTVALLNIGPKSAVDQATAALRAPAIVFPPFLFFVTYSLGGHSLFSNFLGL